MENWQAYLALGAIAILSTWALLWVWSKTSDAARLRRLRNRVLVAILELRLYPEEPEVTWRAFRSLLAANLRYLAAALRPALLTLLPVALLLVQLHAYYGRAPLPLGVPAVLALHMPPEWNGGEVPQLIAPPQIAVTLPPVRALDEHEISWRIVPLRAFSGTLTLLEEGRRTPVRIVAGGPWRPVPARLERIELAYPESRTHWLLWYFGISVAAAFLLKRRMGVMI